MSINEQHEFLEKYAELYFHFRSWWRQKESGTEHERIEIFKIAIQQMEIEKKKAIHSLYQCKPI